MGSPNVPPGITSRVVQVRAANATISTIPAITANKPDQNQERRKCAINPYSIRLGSPKVPNRITSSPVEIRAANATFQGIVTITANKPDSTRSRATNPY